MANDKGFFFRLPPEVRAELEQAHWDTRLDRGEIFLQAFAIWRHAQRRGSLDKVLDAIGYQQKQGREQPGAAANGSGPPEPEPGPEEAAGAYWDLDRAGSGS